MVVADFDIWLSTLRRAEGMLGQGLSRVSDTEWSALTLQSSEAPMNWMIASAIACNRLGPGTTCSKTLKKLGAIENATSPEHKAAAKVLKELVEHHIREEENNVWDDAKEHFSEDERKQTNVSYLSAKARVKVV